MNPWKDPQNAGFHIVQSLLALGSGGLFGVGLGDSRAKFFYLPEQYTDFIFSILGEELGLVGALAVVVLFIVFGYRAIKIAIAAPDRFGFFLVDRLRVDRGDSSLRQYRRRDVVVAGHRCAVAVHFVRRQLVDRQPRSGRPDRKRRSRTAPRANVIADPVVRRFEQQIEAFAVMGSPLYARVAQLALDDYRARGVVHDFFTDVPSRAAASTPGVRLMGALHFLALSGESPELAARFPSCGGDGDAEAIWELAQELLASREERIGELFDETPQTNEVLRGTVLSAGLSAFARNTGLPLRLFEIGASAGLNTRLCGEDGVIAERAACDLHPLDINDEKDRLRLLSFVWADDAERIARLHEAIDAARNLPLVVEQADMFEWLRIVSNRKPAMRPS